MIPPRDYLEGRITQREAARRLGVSRRTYQRIEDRALGRYLLGMCREWTAQLDALESGAPTGTYEIPRRFPRNRPEDRRHAARAVAISSAGLLSWGSGQRAPHLLHEETMISNSTVTRITALVDGIERVPPEDLTPEQIEVAAQAIAEGYAAAFAAIFPVEIFPSDAHSITQYQALIARHRTSTYDVDMAQMHARAVSKAPAVAALARSFEAMQDIEDAARHTAPNVAELRDEAAAAARRRYAVAVTRAILTVEGHELAGAAAQLLALDDLAPRVTAVRERRAELERTLAAEVAAAKRAEQDAAIAKQDAADLEVELATMCRNAGVPETLRTGIWVEANRGRLELLVKLRRRLKTTNVDGVRLSGNRLFAPQTLAGILDTASHDVLQDYARALDRAEGLASS
jgi:hypothetical protein